MLIPVSDSGKAGQILVFERHPSSFDRGFVPASCTLPALRNYPVDNFSDRQTSPSGIKSFLDTPPRRIGGAKSIGEPFETKCRFTPKSP